MRTLLQDLKFGLRMLTKNPGFTAVVLMTLAFGIGANTAIYSVVRTVWLRPLPYNAPDRVVRVWETNSRLGISKFSASIPNFLSWRERSRSFESLVAIKGSNVNLTDQGDARTRRGPRGDGPVLRHTRHQAGPRPFVRCGRGCARATPCGHAQRAPVAGAICGRSRIWSGRTISLNGGNWTVIGIAPADMGFSSDIDIWAALDARPVFGRTATDHHVVVLGRLKPGVPVRQAEAELNRLAAQLDREFPDTKPGLAGAACAGPRLDRRSRDPLRTARSAGRGGPAAPCGVHQRGESAAGARFLPRAGIRNSSGAGRGPRAAGPATCHREPAAGLHGRRLRSLSGPARSERPARHPAGERSSRRSAFARSARARCGSHSHLGDGPDVWPGACVGRVRAWTWKPASGRPAVARRAPAVCVCGRSWWRANSLWRPCSSSAPAC